MDENERQEFSLEDIIKEFSGVPAEDTPPAQEETSEQEAAPEEAEVP